MSTFISMRTVFTSLGIGVVLVGLPALILFTKAQPPATATSTPATAITIATSTPVVVTVAPAVKPVPQKPPVVPRPAPPPVVIPPPIVTDPPKGSIGTTTLAVQSVPLLSGGTVGRTGKVIPISYLQITNVGTEGALLKGFWVKQNGSASVDAIIGLLTVDDRGGSRGRVGGVEGDTPFQHNTAFAPTDAYFKPGQMRLFTIKADLARDLSSYVGTDLKIDVTGLESGAVVQGNFPILGTTWTIGP